MAFKMKGAPMHDTSSKHGTNTNYKKSGAPGLLGKILDPLGLNNKLMGGGKNCPPAGQPQQAAPAPDAPAQPAAPAPAAAAATDPAAAPMKEDLLTDTKAKRKPKKDKDRFAPDTRTDKQKEQDRIDFERVHGMTSEEFSKGNEENNKKK